MNNTNIKNKYSKNIFQKKNLTNNVLSDNNNFSSDNENLSDELNKLTGSSKKLTTSVNYTKSDKYIQKTKVTKSNDLNLIDVYNGINELFVNNYSNCKIIAEIISFKITDTNAWINIKSDEFQILGIFWKITSDINYSNIKLTKPGDKFIFEGKFGIMKKNLSIYLNIKSMVKFGKGDYLDIYDQYRIKIKELGLGEPKKQLEIFPYNIGIITALGGAAIQDILQILRFDKFIGKIIIKNVLVQGSQCPKSLINGIKWFETNYSTSDIDILMITRGGGGWEDLVGFSDWDLLNKLSNTKFITLSAVGHQIDNQLTDEISDLKFATPSIGAKYIVETQLKYKSYLLRYKNILQQIINDYINMKTKFNVHIVKNYHNIIKKYDIKQMTIKIKKYSNQINNILVKYNNLKNTFYSRLMNMKPTIIRKNELTSINDFVDIETNNEIKPKKIEIYFIDGMVVLSYKISKYEKYN
jgi:exodeoxyribonuclease VII large subunit